MNSAPVRIQRKRTKGWKMPDNTVSVCRPGPWGNPFRVGGWFMIGAGWAYCEAREGYQDDRFTKITYAQEAVDWYRRYINIMPGLRQKARRELSDKNLACWCPIGQPCHADVLLEIANGGAE